MAVFENSRYLRTQLFNRQGWDKPTLDIRARFTFKEEDCQTYTWIDGDTLDGVAYKFYGLTSLRWAILDANPYYRSEFDIKNGDTILIPNYEEVVSIVNV